MSILSDITDIVAGDIQLLASTDNIEFNGNIHKAILISFYERALPYENLLRSTMVRIFREQRLEVISNFLNKPIKTYKKDYVHDIFDRKKWDDVVRDDGGAAVRQVVAMEGTYVGLQFGISFNVLSPTVVDFFDTKFYNTAIYNFPIMVNDTTENMLRTILSRGIREGQSVWEIAKNLNTVFDFSENTRALRIARTEITEAMNFADNELYKQTGFIKFKRWIATLDARVRDSHSKLHNVVVKLGELFPNGLEYPGDSRPGKPEETVNCRCTTIAVLPI